MRLTLVLLASVIFGLLVGCSQGDSAVDAGAPDADTASPDAGAAGLDAAGPDAGPLATLILEGAMDGESPGRTLAVFENLTKANGGRCQIEQVSANCFYRDCRPAAPDGGTYMPVVGLNAGNITVGNATQSFTLTPGGDGLYPAKWVQTWKWAGGEEIQFSAAGGPDLPALSASATVPAEVQVTSGADTVALVRSQGLAVTWTPTEPGTRVEVDVAQTEPSAAQGMRAYCLFDGSAGSGTLPPEVLGRFLPDDGLDLSTWLFFGATRCSEQAWGAHHVLACASRWLPGGQVSVE